MYKFDLLIIMILGYSYICSYFVGLKSNDDIRLGFDCSNSIDGGSSPIDNNIQFLCFDVDWLTNNRTQCSTGW